MLKVKGSKTNPKRKKVADRWRDQKDRESERMREQKREREGEGGWRERALNQWSENRSE